MDVQLDALERQPTPAAGAFPGSLVLNSAQMTKLVDWIGKPYLQWRLAYRMSTHGSAAAEFHSRCDNRGPSVTLLRTPAGYACGGYTDVPWDTSNQWHSSRDSFLFSITSNKVYPVGNDPAHAIHTYPTAGPTFGGGHDFSLDLDGFFFSASLPSTYSRDGEAGSVSHSTITEFCGLPDRSSVSLAGAEIEIYVLDRP